MLMVIEMLTTLRWGTPAILPRPGAASFKRLVGGVPTISGKG